MRLDAGKKITLGAMVTALTVLSLYAASTLPWSKVACCFLASVFMYMLARESAIGTAITAFLASSAIAFLLLPDKSPLYAYVALLGHYGIFRTFVGDKVQDRFLRFFLKLVYCNAFTALALALAMYVWKLEIAAYLPDWALWVLLAVLEAVFIGYDLLYGLCQKIYDEWIRNRILPRR